MFVPSGKSQNENTTSSTRSDNRKKKQNKMQNTHKEHEEADTDAVVPTSTDVLCGRGRTYFSHPGNRQFREIVGKSLGAYLDAPTRTQKSKIVKKITIEALENGARFLKQRGKSKSWYVAGQELAKNKVRRNTFDSQNASSTHYLNVKPPQILISKGWSCTARRISGQEPINKKHSPRSNAKEHV